MKTYDYLVAYKFNSAGYLTSCEGTVQISRTKKIKTFEDINELIEDISKMIDGATNLSIYNFIFLGRNKH